MSDSIFRRGPGRPPKTATVPPEAVASTSTLDTNEPVTVAEIADEDMENYGGSLNALEGLSRRNSRLARYSDYLPGSIGAHLPDLSFPGAIVNRHKPDAKWHPAYWEDDGTPWSKMTYSDFNRKGYRPALAEEFLIHPDLRTAIVSDDTGRLTFAPSKAGAHVVMVQDEANYNRIRSIIRRDSDLVQQTAEERAAMLEKRLRDGGMSGARASSKVEDDDERPLYKR